VTLSNTTVISNSASGYGGGISSAAPGGSLAIIDSAITENAAGVLGGGVYQNAGTLTIEGSSVTSNTAQQYGGGIAKSNGTMNIRKSVFAENASSSYGGGIYGSSCVVTIEDSTVRDNQLSGVNGRGGGIFSDAEMTLTNVTVSGNTSLDDGGGIHSQDPMTLTNVTVSGNTSGNGGGILHTTASTMTLLDCTIVNNTIGAGSAPGGMRIYGSVVVRNTIIANNANANCGIESGGSLVSQGYNLESANSCGLNTAGDMTDTNPLIGPLQDNGGTTVGVGEATLTHALLPGSPAINAGDPAFSPPPEYDQRGVGFPRVLYGRVDIGTYEVTVILDHYVYLPLVLKN
jgi:predicted outer membrane repeat protein